MNATPQLIYLAFGADIYQREAVFSIASALAHSALCASDRRFEIQVFTDNPQFYTKLPVTTHAIDPTWNGPHRYHFRIKHALLLNILNKYEKAALIDTDTFFRTSPESLFGRLTGGHLLCNAIGAVLGESPSLPSQSVTYLEQNGLLETNMRQTNSGVIGLTTTDKGVLEHAIKLMDDLRPLAPELYTLEELSLALAAHGRLQLNACTDLIHHYWSRKAQFRAKIQAWHTKHHGEPLSKAAMVDVLLVNDRLPRPPQPYRSWQKAVTALIAKERRQFIRELLYGCHDYSNEFDHACAVAWWDKALVNIEERQGQPLSSEHMTLWLADPLLKLLAGRHYDTMLAHLLSRLKAKQVI
ncbi:MAG: hypothetical protein Q7J43_03005 [Pseudomonas sp.]|uniref:hypothetical protein n=1 Tax=Pseudomonas sp. TaxID=306 RepID=UPI0027212820|nr:hypothetical protein [Pseudomonas sp.]MDO9616637.1 hypothetical protein [Pseudomonas sp.]MDP2445289.1 hypothetical protein [Pseudomonas sp.]MDZ4335442.1 hypothetical protein [Pseudomonas sp.]